MELVPDSKAAVPQADGADVPPTSEETDLRSDPETAHQDVQLDGSEPFVLIRATKAGLSVIAPGDAMEAVGLLAKGAAYLQAQITLNIAQTKAIAAARARAGLHPSGLALPRQPGGLIRP